MENRSFSDVGGTPGGLGHYLLGFVMVCIGGYLLINQVTVVGSYWNFYGENAFGITLLPMLFGIGLLFWRGRSVIGWILTIAAPCSFLRAFLPTCTFSSGQPVSSTPLRCSCCWLADSG